MSAGAGAEVVVADADETQRFAGVVGQLREVHFGRDIRPVDKLYAYVEMTINDLVDPSLDFSHLLFGRHGVELVVAFAFFALNMGIA